jgi:hypothetical protein
MPQSNPVTWWRLGTADTALECHPPTTGQTSSSHCVRPGGSERSDMPPDRADARPVGFLHGHHIQHHDQHTRVTTHPMGSNTSIAGVGAVWIRMRFQWLFPGFQKNSSGGDSLCLKRVHTKVHSWVGSSWEGTLAGDCDC